MRARAAAAAQFWSKTHSPRLCPFTESGQAPTRRSPSQSVKKRGSQPVAAVAAPESSRTASHSHSRKGEPSPTSASHAARGTSRIDSRRRRVFTRSVCEPATGAPCRRAGGPSRRLREPARELGSAVEEGQQRVGLRRGEREDGARDAEVPEAREPRRVHRRAVDGHGDAARVPALLARQPPELRHPRLQVAGAHADREPAVAVVDDARERARAVAAEQDGRVRLLHRLRPRPEGLEAHEVALEGRLVLGPDVLHGEHALAQHAPALLEVGAVVLHLLGVPPAADAEEDAPAREEVEARDLLGGGDRVALDEETDPRADLERGGHGGRRRQRDEQVVRVPVLLRQRRPARPRAPPRDRDVGVLREPERFEAAGLDRARQVVDAHRIVGGEHDDAQVHALRYRSAPRRVKWHVRSRGAGVGSGRPWTTTTSPRSGPTTTAPSTRPRACTARAIASSGRSCRGRSRSTRTWSRSRCRRTSPPRRGRRSPRWPIGARPPATAPAWVAPRSRASSTSRPACSAARPTPAARSTSAPPPAPEPSTTSTST